MRSSGFDKTPYRDHFLGKKEKKEHALGTTLAILFVIALAAAGFFMFWYFGGPGGLIEAFGPGQEPVQESDLAAIEAQESELAAFLAEAETDSFAQEPGTEGSGQEETTAQTESAQEARADGGPDPAVLEQIMQEKSTASAYGIYVYDLEHMEEIEAGASREGMYASALICVPILYAAAVRLDAGTIRLNDPVVYVNSAGGRGEAYPESKDGREYPLSYYLSTMIRYSDNNCMNCLLDYLGMDMINSTCRTAGYGSVQLQRKIGVGEEGLENYVSPADMAGMLRELYGGKFMTIGTEFIRNYFRIDEGDSYRTLIGQGELLPSDALFLNHNGRGDSRYNEIALIGTDECRYILCVMCSGEYGFAYEDAVTEVSRYIYDSLQERGEMNG